MPPSSDENARPCSTRIGCWHPHAMSDNQFPSHGDGIPSDLFLYPSPASKSVYASSHWPHRPMEKPMSVGPSCGFSTSGISGFRLIGSRGNMTQICCDELILRSQTGNVICPEIVDFILGDEERDDVGIFRDVVLSMNGPRLSQIGNRIEIWNTAKDRKALTFTVTRTHSDPKQHACKIEGCVYVRP